MKKRVKQTVFSRYKAIFIPLIALVVLVGALLIVKYALPEPTPSDETVKYDPIEGEGEGQRVFPTLSMIHIQSIRIDRKEGGYAFFRSGENNEFFLAYEDSTGEMQMYYPPVAYIDPSFSYSSLFATDAFGSVSITRLYDLCSGIGDIRYSERIPLSQDPTERAEQLLTYGFSDESVTITVFHTEVDEKGMPIQGAETEKYTLTLGERVITGVGYYVMLEGRDYIYSTSTDTIDYTNKPYAFYISSRITPAGLDEDGAYEPYLVRAFKQWNNVLFGRDKVGTPVESGSRVTVSATTKEPVALDKQSEGGADGYKKSVGDVTFHLGNLASQSEYRRLIEALEGARIGALADPLVLTVVGDGRTVELSDKEEHTYLYRILAVESAIADGERTSGTVGDAEQIRITYDLYLDGEKKNTVPLHGVLTLSDAALSSHVSALRAMSVGEVLASPYDVTVVYDESNADAQTYGFYISEIIDIYSKKYETHSEVTESSVLTYHYYMVIDGERQPEMSGSIDLSLEENASVRSLLVGKKRGELSTPLLLREATTYREILSDFITYEISEIDYFVTEELSVAFGFQNYSERDRFYAEALYQNQLPKDHKNSIYALNHSTCQSLIKLLGGLGDDSSHSIGLTGTETVAVGLTPEIMEQYGLYEYTLYFELPRGIYVKESYDKIDPDDEDALRDLEESGDNYDAYNTLGVTMYVSAADPKTGERYVATDLYDTVVRVSGEPFVFLNYDFIGFWARRQPLLVHVGDVEKVEVEYNMSDMVGTLLFELTHELQTSPTTGDRYDWITVHMTPMQFHTEMLERYPNLAALASGSKINLSTYYDRILGGKDLMHGSDAAGTGYFKEAIQMLYYTSYTGVLTDADRAAVEASAAEGDFVLRYKITVASSAFPYVFEFYRLADRRVAVRLYQERLDGTPAAEPVADFYVNTYAFKRVAASYLALANGDVIDPDDFGYGQ